MTTQSEVAGSTTRAIGRALLPELTATVQTSAPGTRLSTEAPVLTAWSYSPIMPFMYWKGGMFRVCFSC